jgi:hypothetical protein
MKKVNSLEVFALFHPSSFTTLNSKAIIHLPIDAECPTGVSCRIKETSLVTDFIIILSNGYMITFPEIKVHLDLHVMKKGEIFLIQGEHTFAGTGYYVYTLEAYTIKHNYKIKMECPITNDSTIIEECSEGLIIDKRGTKYMFIYNMNITLNTYHEIGFEKQEDFIEHEKV